MRSGTIAFLLGILFLIQFKDLPNPWIGLFFLCWILFLLIVLSSIKTLKALVGITTFILCFLAGFTYSNFYAKHQLAKSFPTTLEKKTLLAKGYINSLPVGIPTSPHFIFVIQQIEHSNVIYHVRLNWFHPSQNLKVGDSWQLTVRLKRPHGFFNPGGFDFEKWIFQNDLQATGYVTDSLSNTLLNSYWYSKPIDRLREYISGKISSSLTDHSFSGLIKALVIGVNNEITQAQWQVFRATGASHLMAISGLHIGLVAGFLFFIIDFVWRHFAKVALYYPARLVGSIAGLIGALIYSALAGFGVPTQRAVIMIGVFMCCTLYRKNLPSWNALLLALLIVILIDPFSIMSVSFWLSFGAVATIIYGLSYRVAPRGLWWKWGRTQWVVTMGLIPLTLFLFQQASLISIIANIIAIPLVGTCVVPLCLVGSLLLVLPIHLGDYLLQLAGFLLKIVWPILTFFANLPHNTLHIPIPNNYLFLLALAGVFLLLAPRGFPQRWLGIILILPLCLYRYAAPPMEKSGLHY